MARSKLNPDQVNEDTLEDADGNTKVQVEESSDENKIRFDTAGTERMIIDATGKVGLGTSTPSEQLTINGADDSGQPAIQFQEGAADRAKIFINSSNNLEIKQQFTNKHIVFKVLDAGTTREAFRMDGAVPEVVVNQTGDSLVDFRVESNNNTHMLFVDGGNDKVGINTDQPTEALDINANSIRLRNSLTPSSAGALGATGQICWDANYLYICIATDTWTRIPHDTW